MGRLIRKSELARWAGVSRQAVTDICKFGGSLADAVEDGRVNVELPIVREWLRTHDVYELPAAPEPTAGGPNPPKRQIPVAKTDGAPTTRPKSPRKSPQQPTAVPHELRDLEHLTVREVAMRYGSIDGFKRFVESLRNIADYKHRDLRVRQQRGELIERSKVAGLVFPMIDVAFQRLVSDVPETVSKLVVARCEAGGPETTADVVQLLRDANSRVLKNLKQTAGRLEILSDAN